MAVMTPSLVERDARIEKGALVAMSAGQHVLGARLGPFHGTPAEFARGQRAKSHVRIIGDLDAEAAADIDALQMNLVDAHAERRRKKLRGEGREGIVRPKVDVIFLGSHLPITALYSSGVLEKRWKCMRSISTTCAACLKAYLRRQIQRHRGR